ncbi:MAG: PLP-dependent aminotransferase family protein [Pirellulales bacterium]|nr:PLP-dependent aminotransferase family protein [Pirellulales bacterium]
MSRRAQNAAGQPISSLMQQALAHPELISLAAGFVDQASLPVELTSAAATSLVSDPVRAREALQYGTAAGHQPLREIVLQRHRNDDGLPACEDQLSVENVVLTAGSNQLLHLVADTILNEGDLVLCGAPTYFVFMGALANLGARSHGVACDDGGLIPEALEDELRRIEAAGELERVKAIYVVSYFDNPSGITLAAERRPQIVEIAKRWSKKQHIYVLDDAAYRSLRYSGEDVPSLQAYDETGETVIVAQTFSKSFSPGIRVGWGILPSALVEPVLNQKGNIDFGSPHFAQHLMAQVLSSGEFDNHVAVLRESYREKQTAMIKAAKEFFSSLDGVHYVKPQGGLYLWMQVPESIDTGIDGKLFAAALQEGVMYVPGIYCYPMEGAPRRHNLMRLSFGVQTPDGIQEGMQKLAAAVRQVL